jgi:hypothetical protein
MNRAIVLIGALLAACGERGAGERCEDGDECVSGFACEQGTCRCQTDGACDAGDYCNSFGACQSQPPCRGNQDAEHQDPLFYCAPGTICDGVTGACLSSGSCGSSVHCDLNNYCEPTGRTCVPGCETTGDCQLGWFCDDGDCVRSNTGSNCTTCPTDPRDAAYCDWGERCGATGACTAHPQASALCQSCDGDTECAFAGMVCLRDDEVVDPDAANANYCSPTCTSDSDCPNGYGGCAGLIIYTEDCSSTGACSNPAAYCLGDPEAQSAFCSCVAQSDCDIYSGSGLCRPYGCQTDFSDCDEDEDCACWDGLCLGTDLPCDSASDCALTCVDYDSGEGDSFGLCETNVKVCGKDTGTSCSELRGGTAVCRDY